MKTPFFIAPGWLVADDAPQNTNQHIPGRDNLRHAMLSNSSILSGTTNTLTDLRHTVIHRDHTHNTVRAVEIGTLADIKLARKAGHNTQGWRNGFATIRLCDSTLTIEASH
ncbi:hypothetical protein [Amycolatopsis sp. NBC_00438]|uniref:hypothetical protein n=1 Tax=Amycolatopsis sp. NBC_00438 TaxID=2903558 RepID=UPI002E1ABAD9